MKGKIFMGALASLSLFLIASACDIGLGGAVDTEIPTGTISSPGVNAVIRDAFAIKGTWKDDGSVGQVTVALSNTNTKTTRTYNAKVAADGTWICAVDPADSAQPLVDGTYLATVTLYDNGGHTNTVTQSYIIDNTPPVVILSYLKSKDDSATEIKTYGKLFTLSGKAADDNNINRIDVKVYQDEGCSTELRTITKLNVPAAIEQDVASFGTEEYSAIYGQNSTNSQVRYCKVFAYDDAQRYPADGSAQTDSDKLGNCQTSYYFQTTIEKLGYDKYKTNDLYAMFNGTYSNGSQDSSRAVLTSDEISTVKKTLTETAVKVGTFALNPKNNPTFTVIGLNKVLLAGGDEDMGTSDSPNSNYVLKNGDANTGTPLTINIVPGLDNYSIDTSTVFAYFQECDKYGNPISGAAKIEIGKNASSFTTNPVSTASYPGLSTSHFYCIIVEGSDTKGSGIEQAYSNGKQQRYAFYLDSIGAAPTLNVKFESSIDGTNWSSNENSLVYLKKDTQVRLSGTVEVEDGTPKLELMLNKNPEYTNSIDPVTELPDWCTEKSDDNIFSFSKTYSASSFGTESKQHSIIIRASQSGRAIEKSYTVLYDQEAPEVSISDVSPIAVNYYDSNNKLNENGNTDGKKYLNGKNVKIKLSITDKYDIVDVTNNLAKIELIDSAGTAKTVAENIDTPTNFTTEAIDTTQFAEGEVKIRVTAYDRAGNMTGKTDGSEDIGGYYIKQATDKPVILPNKNTDFTFTIDSEDKLKSSDGINIFSSGAQLILKLIDDDGLKEVVPYLNDQPDMAQKQTFNSTTNSTYEYTLPSTAGVARLKFVLTDINNNSTTVPASGNIYVKVTGDRPSIEISSEVRKPDTNEAAGYKKLETIYTKGDSGEGANYFANTITIDSVYDKFDVYRAVVDVNAAVPAESSFEKINGDTPITEKTYTDAVRPLESKDYYYYVIATADKLKGSPKKITCKVDKLSPVVTLKALPGKDDTAADSYTFSGTSGDTGGSGVEEVWVTIIDVTNHAKTKTVKATDTISWACPVTYSSFGNVFDDEGDKKITVKAIDAAGNESDSVEQTFLYDKAVPQIEEIKVITSEISKTDFVSGYMPSNGYKLSFKAKDSYQLKNFVVKQVFTPKSGSAVQKDYEFYTGTDSEKEIELRIPYNPSNPADSTYEPQEGTYSYQFTVADQKGNEVSSKTFECIVDNSAPKVTINNQNYTGINAIDKTSFQFEGDISEDNGMSGVYYVIVPNGATVPTPPESNVIHDLIWSSAGFTKVSSFGSTSWKTQQPFATTEDLTAIPKVYKEGKDYKIIVYAVDKAGNVGHVDASNKMAEITFDVDMAKPSLSAFAKQNDTATEEKNIYNISDLTNNAGSFIVKGTAEDSHGIEKIVINVKETGSSSSGTDFTINAADISNKQWSKTFVFGSAASGPDKLADGVYTFTVTAYDLVGKTDVKELSITVDTEKPVVTDEDLKIDDLDFDASKWYDSKTISAEVKVSDGTSGSGISRVQISGDQSNWKTISLVYNTQDKYSGTVQLDDGENQKFYVKAFDKAGNSSEVKEFSVKIDTVVPELTLIKSKIGSAEIKNASGTEYYNGESEIVLYGSYSSSKSGVRGLEFTLTPDNGSASPISPTVLYSTDTLVNGDGTEKAIQNLSYSVSTINDTNRNSVKYWKATFTKDILATGTLTAIGRNNAGVNGVRIDTKLFKLNIDTTPPVLEKIYLLTSSSINSVYEYKAPETDSTTKVTNYYYFVNNNNQTFTISGSANDPKGSEGPASNVANVKLEIPGQTTRNEPTAIFSGIDLSTLKKSETEDATETTATLTVTDNAGNVSDHTIINIKFDTAAPLGVHAFDTSGKDLYFRVGDQKRDDGIITKDSNGNVTSASPDWAASIDEDVGGKYINTTYGNAQTLKIRGNYVDKIGTQISSDIGSGLSMIYYKIYSDSPSTSTLNALLTNASYKNSMDGYFSPIKNSESETEGRRRVFFEAGTTAIKNNLDEEISKTKYITITNKIEKISGEPETKETKKYYTDITSTFKATISGLKENATNYLVLIAEDNVGNANYETVEISTTEKHSDYLINVDTQAPSKVEKKTQSAECINTDLQDSSIKITAVIEDNLSGISNAVVKVNGTKVGTKLFVNGKYTYVTKITEGNDSYNVQKDADTAGEIRLTTEGTVEEVEYSKTKALCEITLNKNAFSGISSGSNAIIQLTVTDAGGTGNSETFNIANVTVDNTPPTVEIKEIGKTDVSSSTSPTTVYSKIKISGSASDNESGIKIEGSNVAATLSLYYRKKTATDTSDPTSLTNLTGWTELTSTTATRPASWSFTEIDTTDLEDNTDYYITVVAEDKAGNKGYSIPKRITVNQDSNRPIITLNNLAFSTGENARHYLKTNTLYLSVRDDDGVSKIEYSLDNGVSYLPYSNGISGLSEGANTIKFKITDGTGKEFESGKADTTKNIGATSYTISNQPKITDGTTTISTGTVALSFNVVTKEPEIGTIQYAYSVDDGTTWSGWEDKLRTVGGKYSKIRVKVPASSAQEISKVEGTYHGSSDTPITFTCSESYNNISEHPWIGEITITSAEEFTGEQTIDITVSDTVTPEPMTATKNLKFSVDNKKPVVTIGSPVNNSLISLAQTVRGSINETSSKLYYALSRYAKTYEYVTGSTEETTIESTKYEISKVTPGDSKKTDTDGTVLATKWEQIEGDYSSGTWYVYFDDSNANTEADHTKKFAEYLTEDYLNITTTDDINKKDDPYDIESPVYFWIKAVDDCGNESSAYYKYIVNPQGERPSVQITTPENDADGNAPKLGGTIRVQGLATDNNAAKYAWIQIDSVTTKADGSFDKKTGDGKFTLEDLKVMFNATKKDGTKLYTIGKITENKEIQALTGITDSNASEYAIRTDVKSSSWGLSINSNHEFNPDNTDQNSENIRTLNLTVYATDEDKDEVTGQITAIHTSAKKTQQIIIDARNPYIEESSLRLVQYDDNGEIVNSQTYTPGSVPNVKGIWYLTGYIKDDDSGIKKITYNTVDVIDLELEPNNKNYSSGSKIWFKQVDKNGNLYTTSSTGIINYQFSIPLGDETRGIVGTSTATIKAIENTDNNLETGDKTFSVTFDNKAPEFITTAGNQYVKLDNRVQNSSGFYTFGAIASEDDVNGVSQTGVERIAFYFTRDLNYSLKKDYDPVTYSEHGDENTNDLFDVMIYHSNIEGSDNPSSDKKSGNMIINYGGKVSSGEMVHDDGLYWHKISGSIASNSFTYTVEKNLNIHPRGLVKINGKIYLISSVDEKTVGISGTLDDVASVDAYFAVCNVIDNGGEKNGSAINYPNGYGYGYYPVREGKDDGDLITETFNAQGTEWIFDAAINSKNLPDGPITLHMVAFDKAGNASEEWTSSSFVVSNNAPRIAGLRIGTDENGNGSVSDDELILTYSAKDSSGNEKSQWKYKNGYMDGNTEDPITEITFPVQGRTPSSIITVKGHTVVKPELVGGNGTIRYTYKVYKRGASDWETTAEYNKSTAVSLGTGTTDTILDAVIDLPVSDFIGTEDGKDKEQIKDGQYKKFAFSFGDSTPGETPGDSISNPAALNVIMDVALRETTKAQNYILPFYWNSSSDNSLFGQNKENGHIELSKDLYGNSNFTENTTPKVSGKIKIEGIAWDDTLLNEIKVQFATSMGGLGTTNTTIASYNKGSDSVAPSWNVTALESDGSINSTTGWASAVQQATYAELVKVGKITATEIPSGKDSDDRVPYTSQEYGHVVHWILYLDTEKVYGVVATGVIATATATDRGKPKWKASANAAEYTSNDVETTGGTAQSGGDQGDSTLTGTYQMDVVPYITSVSRNSSYNTNRARSGATPLLRGETGNTVEGFNLGKDTGSTIAITLNTKADGTGTSYTMTSPAVVTAGKKLSFTMPATAKDGYLTVSIDGKESLNNKNDDSLAYNKENTANVSSTDYWTDTRYVRVWQSNTGDYFKGSELPIYPSMAMGSDGDLYASWSNYSKSSVYYSKIGTETPTQVFYGYDPPEETDICVSGTGTVNVLYNANYHGGLETSWAADTNSCGGLYMYDTNAQSWYVGRDKRKIHRFELFYHNKMLQQFKNMRVKRANSANSGIVHVAYYDRTTSSIHYSEIASNFQTTAGGYFYNNAVYGTEIANYGSPFTDNPVSTNEISWVNIDGGHDADDNKYHKDSSSKTYNDQIQSVYLTDARFEDSTKRCAGTGESVGLALTKTNNYPVLVYYDSSNSILKLARATSATPKGNVGLWTVQEVLATTDQNYKTMVDYIACDIDSSGILHIVFQNTKGNLCYVKSTNTSANGNTKYEFTSSVVVAESATNIALTLKGTVPYISYLTRINSFDGMNIAYYDSTLDLNCDGTAEGGWETMTAPLNYKVANGKSCIAAHPSPASSAWEAAVGFTPGDLYRVAYYVGNGSGH